MFTQEEARKELALRELARRKLDFFTTYTKPDYEMTATQGGVGVHRLIIEKLEAVERGEINRLIISCPPGLGKSELVSKRFPTWAIGRNPKRNVLLASYSAELANGFGRQSRGILDTQEFKNVFPDCKLSQDKREGGNWETEQGGGMYTSGLGGSITGKRADILIGDDLVKGRKNAESLAYQKEAVEWYTTTFFTRKRNQNTPIIIMMTRWGLYDIAGYLIENEKNGGDHWDILTIPAINEKGEHIIWPGKWDFEYVDKDGVFHKAFMDKEKANLSNRDWAAVYQQDPIASSTCIFRLEDFRYFLSSDFEKADGILKKDDLRCIIAVDPAFSTSKTSDDAVVECWGKHKLTGNYYLLDGYADTSAPSHTFQAILSMYDRVTMDGYKVDFISVESVSLSRDQTKFVQDFKTFLKEKGRYITVNEWKPEGKKEERIKFILEPKASLNALHLRKDMPDASFVRKFETQIVDFPHGKHDDVIDCAAQAIHVFESRGSNPVKPDAPKPFFNRITGQVTTAKPIYGPSWKDPNGRPIQC
jgi:hypothetical protein